MFSFFGIFHFIRPCIFTVITTFLLNFPCLSPLHIHIFFVGRELEKILATSELEDLYKEIPEDNPLMIELKSLAMHNAYHIGQIVFLSKMQGVWEAKRSF